ncbi:MAG: hypothetical protein J7456_04840 [Chloroflexus sp.]|jgi:hypothetical protein|uniref:hypothetical protein n=1 Tax=Chloroflexus sp. MS-G TaxID=1521187 RepID=UPI0004DF30A9|nr:hypothetical protein [Chloroflexus sp. MS-G]MBO9315095.1 hypothetical protein [Chloroflexus sp.]MBO9318364.1 hypothetical protein [Chloroflexus sp.]MBO9348788.1 hypothetical protein [Chloroflexus sp.]
MRLPASDRFLIGIVVGSVLLIIIAVVIVLNRATPAYRTGNEPADVVFNYLLAVQQGDYERAYSFLSPTLPGYPRNVQEMRSQLPPANFSNEDVSFTVISLRIDGDWATVDVRETTVYRSGLFGSNTATSVFTVGLQRRDGIWQLVSNTNWRTWSWCWEQEGGCR